MMHNDPQNGTARGFERGGLEALIALLLAPLIVQGLWLPMGHAFGLCGSAWQVTDLALATAASMVATRNLVNKPSPWLLLVPGGIVAVAGSATLSLGVAELLTLLSLTAALAGLLPWLASRLPAAIDGLARRHKRTAALYMLASVAVIASTARVSIYMGDPTRSDYQAVPGDAFIETHSCLTAYVRASSLINQHVANLYADHWWHGSLGLPPLAAGQDNPYRPFHLDNFSYPPPFLLLVTPLNLLEDDFAAQRALWFGLNGLLLAFGLWIVARWMDGPNAHRTLLLAPLFLGCPPTLAMLQIGNFQIACVVLAILAMVALDRQRNVLGGALLALTILSKVSPGILALTLLLQRRWREAIYCVGFGLLLLGASALWFGLEPIQSFQSFAVPRLSSGKAFPFMATEDGLVTNLSPFGIPFKLPLFGVDIADPWHLGRVFARVYTGALLLLTVTTARRSTERVDQAITWMAFLVLASLQSPFAPAYVAFGLLWATTLLATRVQSPAGIAGLVGLWILALVVPQDLSVAQHAAHALMQSALVVGVCTWLVVRRMGRVGEEARAQPR